MSASTVFLICSCVAAVVGAFVWSIAWRVGFGEGRLTIPLRLVHAVAEHEVACCNRDPEQVVHVLCRDLTLPERECRRLVASKLRSATSSRVPPAVRSA